ncbi:MAG: hypothetical protein J3R72DRAFT_432574, partial [Linnemannia gamsii]
MSNCGHTLCSIIILCLLCCLVPANLRDELFSTPPSFLPLSPLTTYSLFSYSSALTLYLFSFILT